MEEKSMTKNELLGKLSTITGDPEVDHVNADNALLEYIGDEEITKEFNNLKKFYS